MGLLSLSNLAICIKKAEFSDFKGQIAFKFDVGLFNAYKLMYFDRNINGNKDAKIWEAINESCVTSILLLLCTMCSVYHGKSKRMRFNEIKILKVVLLQATATAHKLLD